MAKAKSKEPEIKATKKNLEPEVVAKRPAQTHTEILAEPKKEFLDEVVVKPKPMDKAVGVITESIKVEVAKPKIESLVNWIRMPLGLFDFDSIDNLFRNETAENNKKAIERFDFFMSKGYSIKSFDIDNGYMYIFFERK